MDIFGGYNHLGPGAATARYHREFDYATNLAYQGLYWDASRYAHSAAYGRGYVADRYYGGFDNGHRRAFEHVSNYAYGWEHMAGMAFDLDPFGNW